MIVIGIDPGKNGAVVAVEQDGPHLVTLAQALLCDLSDFVPPLIALLLRNLPKPDRVVLEACQAARTATGAVGGGSLKIGRNWGVLYACACLVWPGVDILVPYPQTWTRILRDQPGEGKARAVALVSARLPDLDLTPGKLRKPHSGLADAGALALYGLVAQLGRE